MKKCHKQHTTYQPKRWFCPRCGATRDDSYAFYIEDYVSDECDLLHVDDYIVCNSCNWDWSGEELALEMEKAGI